MSFSMRGDVLQDLLRMLMVLTVCLHSYRECSIKTACVILSATSFTFPTAQRKTRKLFVAIRSITQQGHYTTISRKPKSPKETEKAERILVLLDAERVLQCFI